jgi:mRNA interferase RelE/StbE
MASYKIEWKKSAAKDLKNLPSDLITRIVRVVEQLADNPFPHGVKKLAGAEHSYRIREGAYRILYTVGKGTLTIEIVKIGHRKDVYDR